MAGGRAGGVCLFVCGSVTTITRNCVHRSSPKLGLYVKIVTISNGLNFARPAPPGRWSAAGEFFDSALLQPARSVCVSLRASVVSSVTVNGVNGLRLSMSTSTRRALVKVQNAVKAARPSKNCVYYS